MSETLTSAFYWNEMKALIELCAYYKLAHIARHYIISTFGYEKHFVLHISCLSNILF